MCTGARGPVLWLIFGFHTRASGEQTRNLARSPIRRRFVPPGFPCRLTATLTCKTCPLLRQDCSKIPLRAREIAHLAAVCAPPQEPMVNKVLHYYILWRTNPEASAPPDSSSIRSRLVQGLGCGETGAGRTKCFQMINHVCRFGLTPVFAPQPLDLGFRAAKLNRFSILPDPAGKPQHVVANEDGT
jgi:hypothetical protein